MGSHFFLLLGDSFDGMLCFFLTFRCADDCSANQMEVRMIFLKKSLSVLSSIALFGMFVACDSDSTSARPDEEVCSSSSSAETLSSSSSVILSGGNAEVDIESSTSSVSMVDPADVIIGTMVDARDNQTYKTVTIGTQTWMAENLNYDYNVSSSTEKTSSFCYGNEVENCDKYGRLYLWSASIDSLALFSSTGAGCGYGVNCSNDLVYRGACPENWHLPNVIEWKTLFESIGGVDSAGIKLNAQIEWSKSSRGNNLYGFEILPAGFGGNETFYDNGIMAGFWTSKSSGGSHAYIWEAKALFDDMELSASYKYGAFSIRCVKD